MGNIIEGLDDSPTDCELLNDSSWHEVGSCPNCSDLDWECSAEAIEDAESWSEVDYVESIDDEP